MMEWEYGDHWEAHPIEEGEIWEAGPNRLMATDIMTDDLLIC